MECLIFGLKKFSDCSKQSRHEPEIQIIYVDDHLYGAPGHWAPCGHTPLVTRLVLGSGTGRRIVGPPDPGTALCLRAFPCVIMWRFFLSCSVSPSSLFVSSSSASSCVVFWCCSLCGAGCTVCPGSSVCVWWVGVFFLCVLCVVFVLCAAAADVVRRRVCRGSAALLSGSDHAENYWMIDTVHHSRHQMAFSMSLFLT